MDLSRDAYPVAPRACTQNLAAVYFSPVPLVWAPSVPSPGFFPPSVSRSPLESSALIRHSRRRGTRERVADALGALSPCHASRLPSARQRSALTRSRPPLPPAGDYRSLIGISGVQFHLFAGAMRARFRRRTNASRATGRRDDRSGVCEMCHVTLLFVRAPHTSHIL